MSSFFFFFPKIDKVCFYLPRAVIPYRCSSSSYNDYTTSSCQSTKRCSSEKVLYKNCCCRLWQKYSLTHTSKCPTNYTQTQKDSLWALWMWWPHFVPLTQTNPTRTPTPNHSWNPFGFKDFFLISKSLSIHIFVMKPIHTHTRTPVPPLALSLSIS